MVRRRLGLWAALACLLFFCGGCGESRNPSEDGYSGGDNYPSGPITLVVPYGVEGAYDVVAQELCRLLGTPDFLDQPVNVSTVLGGATMEGCAEVAAADPDGYTLLYQSDDLLTFHAWDDELIRYTYSDFTPVVQLTAYPYAVTCLRGSPWTTVEELVDYAENNTGEVRLAYVIQHSGSHLAALLFLEHAGIGELVELIPYLSDIEASIALDAGDIDVLVHKAPSLYQPEYAPEVEKSFLILCLSGDPGGDQWPGIPTFGDLGYGVDLLARQGLYAPLGTPQEVVDILADASIQAVDSSSFQYLSAYFGLTPSPMNGQDWKTLLEQDYAFIRQAARRYSGADAPV